MALPWAQSTSCLVIFNVIHKLPPYNSPERIQAKKDGLSDHVFVICRNLLYYGISLGMKKTAKTKAPAKHAGGRPPMPANERLVGLSIRLPQDMLDAVDTARKRRFGSMARTEFIRIAIAKALES